MIAAKKLIGLFLLLLVLACNKKADETIIQKEQTESTVNIPIEKSEEAIEGTYTSNECGLLVKITKTKDGYAYFLQTSARKLKGRATFTKNASGENYLVLEGIQWDAYEGDISNEDDTDSISDKELEIPVGIDASYVKDTLTIQNYGNSMNSYTKLSECGGKYLQLIKQ